MHNIPREKLIQTSSGSPEDSKKNVFKKKANFFKNVVRLKKKVIISDSVKSCDLLSASVLG